MSRGSAAASAEAAAADPAAPGALGAPPAQLRVASATHPGRVREQNEDRVHVDAERGILIVVDGLGGEAAGELAAETALERVRRRLERRTGTPEERLREAIAVANHDVLALAASRKENAGMGCVLTAALVEDGHVTLGHVGDSRLYVLRGGRLTKITHDHSPVGEREDRGELAERDAMNHPRRNEVYRSVGTEAHGPADRDWIEIARFALAPGHALLMCSDGLTDLVPSDEITRIALAHAADPARVVDRLIEAALAAGGKDNVSVVFAVAVGAPREPGGERMTRPDFASRLARRLAPRWVQFGLGALAGAALAFALTRLGGTPPAPLPVIAPEVAPARALVVGPRASFRSIGDALAAARPGDSVIVAPGVYREQVRLVDGVTLVAARPREAVLEPPPGAGDAVVAVVAERLGSGRIAGLTIRGAPGAAFDIGIRVSDAAVTIDDVAISGARVAAVVFEGGRAASLRASRVHDNPGAGVLLRAGATARLAHDVIAGNGGDRRRPAAGIELERGARADLEANVITGNAVAGVRGAPARDHAAMLANNRFERNGGERGRAIVAEPRR